MSKLNNKKIDLISIFDTIREYHEFEMTKRSQSPIIYNDYNEEVIIRNIYKKTKIIIKRPQEIIDNLNSKKAKSVSKKKCPKNKYLTYNKKLGNKINTNINCNKFISSANKKVMKPDNNIKLINQFNFLDNSKYNNELENKKKTLFLIKIMNKLYLKYLKEKYSNKMKSILHYYSQKQNKNNMNNSIELNTNKNDHLYYSSSDINKKKQPNNNTNNMNKKRNQSTKIIKRNNTSSKRNSSEQILKS